MENYMSLKYYVVSSNRNRIGKYDNRYFYLLSIRKQNKIIPIILSLKKNYLVK